MDSNQVVALPGAARVRAAARSTARSLDNNTRNAKRTIATTDTDSNSTSTNPTTTATYLLTAVSDLIITDELDQPVEDRKTKTPLRVGATGTGGVCISRESSTEVASSSSATTVSLSKRLDGKTGMFTTPYAMCDWVPEPKPKNSSAPNSALPPDGDGGWSQDPVTSSISNDRQMAAQIKALEEQFTVPKSKLRNPYDVVPSYSNEAPRSRPGAATSSSCFHDDTNVFRKQRSKSFDFVAFGKAGNPSTEQSYHQYLGIDSTITSAHQKHLSYDEKKKLMELKSKLIAVKGKDHTKTARYEYRIGKILHRHGIPHPYADFYATECMRLDHGLNAL